MSSPCSVQQMPQPIASLSAGASEISIELEMSITSGRGSERNQWTSLSNSFRWWPCRPSSTETVSSPNCSGCVCTPRCETARSSHGDSHRRSISQGVPRKSREYCSR